MAVSSAESVRLVQKANVSQVDREIFCALPFKISLRDSPPGRALETWRGIEGRASTVRNTLFKSKVAVVCMNAIMSNGVGGSGKGTGSDMTRAFPKISKISQN
jgi:hypothetical protein